MFVLIETQTDNEIEILVYLTHIHTQREGERDILKLIKSRG